MRDLNKDKEFWKPAIIVLLAAILGVAIGCMVYLLFAPKPAVSATVENFLAQTTSSGNLEHELFEKTFTELQGVEWDEDNFDSWPKIVTAVDEVFFSFHSEHDTYSIVALSADTLLLYPQFQEEPVNPPIYFHYTLKNGRVEQWQIARLLPLSRYSPEYSEAWDAVYN